MLSNESSLDFIDLNVGCPIDLLCKRGAKKLNNKSALGNNKSAIENKYQPVGIIREIIINSVANNKSGGVLHSAARRKKIEENLN